MAYNIVFNRRKGVTANYDQAAIDLLEGLASGTTVDVIDDGDIDAYDFTNVDLLVVGAPDDDWVAVHTAETTIKSLDLPIMSLCRGTSRNALGMSSGSGPSSVSNFTVVEEAHDIIRSLGWSEDNVIDMGPLHSTHQMSGFSFTGAKNPYRLYKYFDGGGYVDNINLSSYTASKLKVTAYVYCDNVLSNKRIVNTPDEVGAPKSWSFYQHDGRLSINLYDDQAWNFDNVSLQSNTWHDVEFTFDNGSVECKIDGVSAGTGESTLSSLSFSNLEFGHQEGANRWLGVISDVKVYADDVLIGDWPIDDENTTIKDYSGNNYDGIGNNLSNIGVTRLLAHNGTTERAGLAVEDINKYIHFGYHELHNASSDGENLFTTSALYLMDELEAYKAVFQEQNNLNDVEIKIYTDESKNNLADTIYTGESGFNDGEAEGDLFDGQYWWTANKEGCEEGSGSFEIDGELSGTDNVGAFINFTLQVITHTLTINIEPEEGYGSVTKTPDKVEYDYEEEVTIEAVAEPGNEFVEWTGDLASTDNPTSIIMNEDKEVTCTFKVLSTNTNIEFDEGGDQHVNAINYVTAKLVYYENVTVEQLKGAIKATDGSEQVYNVILMDEGTEVIQDNATVLTEEMFLRVTAEYDIHTKDYELIETQDISLEDWEIDSWTKLNKIRITDSSDPDYIGGLNGNYVLVDDLTEDDIDYYFEVTRKTEDFTEQLGSSTGNDSGTQFQVSYAPIAEIIEATSGGFNIDISIINPSAGIIQLNQDTTEYLTIKYKTSIGRDFGFLPIGEGLTQTEFTGSFDGDNHTISGLYINRPNEDKIGLFWSLGAASEIKNLNLKRINLSGNHYVGGLSGYGDSTSIEKCKISGIVKGQNYIGGVIGYLLSSAVNTSSSTANITSVSYAGGSFGGSIRGTDVNNSYATGDVFSDMESTVSYVGGFVGNIISDYGTVSNCYATGDVYGRDYTGGFASRCSRYTLNNCYSVGANYGTTSTRRGGFLGSLASDATVNNCGWFTGAGGNATSAIGEGGSTVDNETSDIADFYDKNYNVYVGGVPTWDFNGETGIWHESIDNLNFPKLVAYEGIEPAIEITKIEDEINVYTAITNWSQLQGMNDNLSGNYILVNNLSEATVDYPGIGDDWTPIGNSSTKFTGSFDGNGHTISDLIINKPSSSYIGFFGHSQNAQMSNVDLVNINIEGNSYVGGLLGYSIDNMKITNCSIIGSIQGNNDYVGGIIGSHYSISHTAIIENCYFSGTVACMGEQGGGVIGRNAGSENDTIKNCYSTGVVYGEYRNIGGFIGYNISAVTYENCYSESEILLGETTAKNNIGGFVGYMSSNSDISNCYALGDISYIGSSNINIIRVGGFAGRNDANLEKCYSSGTIELMYEEEEEGETIYKYLNSEKVGGLVGYSITGSIIKNCYSTCNITTNGEELGGLVGYSTGNIINSYASGNIQTDDAKQIGGLIGRANSDITNSFSVGEVHSSSVEHDKDIGGFVGLLESGGSTTNCGWFTENNDDAEHAIGTKVINGTYDPASVDHEVSAVVDFYNQGHNIYTLNEPYWDFEDIWVVNIAFFPTFEPHEVIEEVVVEDSIEVNPGIELEKIYVEEDFSYGVFITKNINQIIATARLVSEDCDNIINTAIETRSDIENKNAFVKQTIQEIHTDFRSCVQQTNNPLNFIHIIKRKFPTLINDVRTQKEASTNIINDFRLLTQAQIPGDAGVQSLGKEYIKVYFDSVEEENVDIDSIKITKSLDTSSSAEFSLAVPFDSPIKPEQETKVEIFYDNSLLFVGYIFNIQKEDNPENIRIECKDKFWLDNRELVSFNVGHKPEDETHKYYSTPKEAFNNIWDLNWNIGDFVPEEISCFASNKAEALVQLTNACGNYQMFYDNNENIKLHSFGSGSIITLDAQVLGKNIDLHNVISHSFSEHVDSIINRYFVQMGNRITISKAREESVIKESLSIRTHDIAVAEVNPVPAWEQEFRYQGFSRNPQVPDYFKRPDYEPSWKYNEVFIKYTLPKFITRYESWSDIRSPQIYITPPSHVGFTEATRRPGWSHEGFSIDYEHALFNFNSPTYYEKFKATRIRNKNTGETIIYNLLSDIRRVLLSLKIWKERVRTITGDNPIGEFNQPDHTKEDWQISETYFNDNSFWTEKQGDYSKTIEGFLALSGYDKKDGMVWVDDAGNPQIIKPINDIPFAKDIAYWEQSKTCDKKIVGEIEITLDSFVFYGIDLDKRIRVRNAQEDPLNISNITIDIGAWTVNCNLESGRPYKRKVSVDKYSQAKTGRILHISALNQRISEQKGRV